MGRPRGHIDAVDHDLAAGRRQQAHDRAQQRRLAHAVVADDADGFALVELQRHAAQHRHFPVAGMQVGDLEHHAVGIGILAANRLAAIRIVRLANAHARFPR